MMGLLQHMIPPRSVCLWTLPTSISPLPVLVCSCRPEKRLFRRYHVNTKGPRTSASPLHPLDTSISIEKKTRVYAQPPGYLKSSIWRTDCLGLKSIEHKGWLILKDSFYFDWKSVFWEATPTFISKIACWFKTQYFPSILGALEFHVCATEGWGCVLARSRSPQTPSPISAPTPGFGLIQTAPFWASPGDLGLKKTNPRRVSSRFSSFFTQSYVGLPVFPFTPRDALWANRVVVQQSKHLSPPRQELKKLISTAAHSDDARALQVGGAGEGFLVSKQSGNHKTHWWNLWSEFL